MGSDDGLEHDYVKAGFALSVNPMVWEYIQANDRIDGKVRHALERLVRKMHVHPNPNSKDRGMQERGLLIYIGRSLRILHRNQLGEFGNLTRFRPQEARAGKSHLWH